MSAKTCQLCGKTLGRMRSSDGEFCSREHRNQFRLRRGMDRLEEANKVANLMRRRENPRQISPADLAVSGGMEPRGSSTPLPFPVRQLEPQFASSKPALFQVRIAKKSESFCNPLSDLFRRSRAGADRRMTPASVPFVSRPAGSPVLALSRSTKPAAGVVRAGLATLPCRVPAASAERKHSGAALRVARRLSLPNHRTEARITSAAAVEKTRRLQALTASPAAANPPEPRVQPSREFARRAPVVRAPGRSPGTPSALPHSRLRQSEPLQPKEHPASERLCGIPRAEGILRLPSLRRNGLAAGARQAPPVSLAAAAYDTPGAAGLRPCFVLWDTANAVTLPASRRGPLRFGLSAAGNPLSLQWAIDAARDPKPAEVRFAPADSSFELTPMSLQGGFGASHQDSTQPSLEVIEEHFDNGLDHWVGDLVEWKLDAAGARPAGLALLRPTLNLGDYEFEFFTRIESRAVTFAFRAANVSNFFKVTIAMVESGRYELKRCAVIGGIEEPPVSSPLPGVLRPGSAFTVKTRAAQNDFSIWLDGELAARWTDGRLPTGGIGFMAPRDDRARVYWVRLSQIDGHNSHAGAHRTVRSIQ